MYHIQITAPVACPQRWHCNETRSAKKVYRIRLSVDNRVYRRNRGGSDVAKDIREAEDWPAVADGSVVRVLGVRKNSIIQEVLADG